MQAKNQFTPKHKIIKKYYQEMREYDAQRVTHESAVRDAFKRLLFDAASARGWSFISELSERTRESIIRPDGTIRDSNGLPRGHYEAKDRRDDLNAEIKKKIARGYPLKNIIFEDTRRAVLYQDKRPALEIELERPEDLARLLNQYFEYTEPDIEEFEKAVEEFSERVPELARGLSEKIGEAHENNSEFQKAFADFFDLCKTSLNPNLSQSAVDEMLVQHLLTERLLRNIFNNSDFTRRNVIAAEVEKVVDALVSQSFNRSEYLQSLDPFYAAIENAARALADFDEKQRFINRVYERFFQGYCVRVADTHGIVYTPESIVKFMCNSVAEALQREFGQTLGGPGVTVLDPCTGTGNFIVHLMQLVSGADLAGFYRDRLFANEVMLMPYYIASLNIEHAYFERMKKYAPFEGICFVDTLDMVESKDMQFGFKTEANTERVERQQQSKITVIIGNPPYNVGQINENDNNKNRKYPLLDARVRSTYVKDSSATNKNSLFDAYVRFWRWATDRLGNRDGVVCFVTNNSFADQIAFNGMRKHLIDDFTRVYHVDLHGNVRKNPKLSGTTHNVFGIQVGVGITVAIRCKKHKKKKLFYHRVPEFWRKEEKYQWLEENKTVYDAPLRELTPDARHNWLVSEHEDEFLGFISIGNKDAKQASNDRAEAIFKTFSGGIKSNRDAVVYDFNREALAERMATFVENYNAEVDRYKRAHALENVDDFVRYDKIKWDSTLKRHLKYRKTKDFDSNYIRPSLYRPFCKNNLYFDGFFLNSIHLMHHFFPKPDSENVLIWLKVGTEWPMFALAANQIVDLLPQGGSQCFPFYVYNEDGSDRAENITDWALERFREHYSDRGIGKWDVFYYVYAMLHHPTYRERYADCLKRELPRVPFAPGFAAFARAGRELAELHLQYETLKPYPLKWKETKGAAPSFRVEKMRLSADKRSLKVNDWLTLEGVPPEAFEYRLGNRSALEWVIDQYQIKTPKGESSASDPNRLDDERYIVNLAGRVIALSLRTGEIVNALPALS
ncbi:MAG: N-6 DNA methylase [bacterium]|nr:N-6 DNA methylase [bacterium]